MIFNASINYNAVFRPSQNKINLKELIKGISKVLQKLFKYFNGAIISTPSILHLFPVRPVIFAVKLNESVALAPLNSTIKTLLFTAVCLYNIAINFYMFLNNYHYILWNYTLALLY